MTDKASRATLGMAAGLVVVVGALLYLTRPPQPKASPKRPEETAQPQAPSQPQSDLPSAPIRPVAPPAEPTPAPCPVPPAPQAQPSDEKPARPVGVSQGPSEAVGTVERVALYAMYEGDQADCAVAVVGNIHELGGWNVASALRLTRTGARGEWRADLTLQRGTQCEFKCILVDQEGVLVRWEVTEGNRWLHVDGPMTVRIDVDVQGPGVVIRKVWP